MTIAETDSGQARLATVEGQVEQLERLARRWSVARLLTFLAFIAGLILWSWSPLYPATLSAPALAAFVAALVLHTRILRRLDTLRARALLLREALERQQSRRRPRQAPELEETDSPLARGMRGFAAEPRHHELDPGVVEDLALLDGGRTLFGFLDTSSTVFGARRLRWMLTRPLLDPADIRVRQAAVRELASRPGTRDSILEALVGLRERSFESVPGSLRAPRVFTDPRLVLLGAHVLGTAGLAALITIFFWLPALALCFVFFVVNMAFIGRHVKRANTLRDRVLLLVPLLRAIDAAAQELAAAELESDELREIRGVLSGLRPLTRRLRRHAAILALHEYGPLFEVINVFTLLELRVLPLSERALLERREEIERAIGALGELEALLSLSGPLVEQDDFCAPEPLERDTPEIDAPQIDAPQIDAPQIDAIALAHPLIERHRAVRNPVRLGGADRVWIITGSNMSGKSTILKAVAVNAILAGAGGPTCARSFRWTPLAVHTDINIRDSLDDGKSYFQVEVERVLRVLRAAEESPRILAVFDELFRGTNSEERLAISRAILRKLRSRGILLLVATHDLELSKLVTVDREEAMSNHHFREAVEGRTMTFDYVLREGPATTRNALRVLEVSGYPEDVINEARGDN